MGCCSSSQAVPHPPLPEGWSIGFAPCGRIFYLDHTTQTTCWERPLLGANDLRRQSLARMFWTCAHCTFQNPPTEEVCQVCV